MNYNLGIFESFDTTNFLTATGFILALMGVYLTINFKGFGLAILTNIDRNMTLKNNDNLEGLEIIYKGKTVNNLRQCIILIQNYSHNVIIDKDFIKQINFEINDNIIAHNSSDNVKEVFHSSNEFASSVFIHYSETNTFIFHIDLI